MRKIKYQLICTLTLLCYLINCDDSVANIEQQLQTINQQQCSLTLDNTTLTCKSKNVTVNTFTNYLTNINPFQVHTLNLIDCNIPVLPTQFFHKYNLTNLLDLKIINCELTNIEENAFYGVRKMEKLIIQHNNLSTSLKENQFNDLRQVIDLNLDHNQIADIPELTFNGLNRLVNLSLDYNNIKTLRKDFILSSAYIRRVSLKHSGVQSIEPQAFGFRSSLKEIDISGNRIYNLRTGAFNGLNDIEYLNLRNLSIRTIDPRTFGFMQTLKHLDLSHNNIQNITAETFWGLFNLHELNLLGNNHLKLIGNSSFMNLNHLEKLLLPKYVYKQFLTPGFFFGLDQLQQLDLSNSDLDKFNPDVFIGLENLQTLNLSHNNFEYLNYSSFHALQNLQTLDISFNHLVNMDIELCVCTYNYMLKNIFVRQNPWNCKRLLQFLRHFQLMNIKYDVVYSSTPYICCDQQTYKREQPILPITARNIKSICQEIPMNEPIKTIPSTTVSTTTVLKPNIIIENVKTKIVHESNSDLNAKESTQFFMEFNYVAALLILLVAFGFSFLLYHLIFISASAKKVHGYMYSFSGATIESKLNLVDDNIDSNV